MQYIIVVATKIIAGTITSADLIYIFSFDASVYPLDIKIVIVAICLISWILSYSSAEYEQEDVLALVFGFVGTALPSLAAARLYFIDNSSISPAMSIAGRMQLYPYTIFDIFTFLGTLISVLLVYSQFRWFVISEKGKQKALIFGRINESLRLLAQSSDNMRGSEGDVFCEKMRSIVKEMEICNSAIKAIGVPDWYKEKVIPLTTRLLNEKIESNAERIEMIEEYIKTVNLHLYELILK